MTDDKLRDDAHNMAEELSEEHWFFIEKLYRIAMEREQSRLTEISFHYQTAFAHGFKHGVEWANVANLHGKSK